MDKKSLGEYVKELQRDKLRKEIMDFILTERRVQDEKWGPQDNHTLEKWYTILGEEFGEVGRGILEDDVENIKEELIQLAAVAAAIYEHLDRGTIA
jgi:hypothetical protein